ncbi:hypothetical protein GQ53DRAFT_358360 [Thozetella sp. PMI_491]|nr:hypothetical protein GQ53DRAFT_358360 [Thozetella sp. PMI_491]
MMNQRLTTSSSARQPSASLVTKDSKLPSEHKILAVNSFAGETLGRLHSQYCNQVLWPIFH